MDAFLDLAAAKLNRMAIITIFLIVFGAGCWFLYWLASKFLLKRSPVEENKPAAEDC